MAAALIAAIFPARADEAPPPAAPAEGCLPPDPAPALDGGTPDGGDEADDATADGDDTDDDDTDDATAAPGPDPEAESHEASTTPANAGVRYSADLSDEELQRRWKSAPETLGSISVGFADAGRLINGIAFPNDGNWIVVDPGSTYGTQETVDDILAAIHEVNARFPGSPPLRVNHIGKKDGGYLRPHQSHQSGRDADIAFFYPTAEPVRIREREKCIDRPRNWALVRALVVNTDVQVILLDRRVQKVLWDYALSIGEDRAWLDTLFHAAHQLVQHARHHRDHFHVRFYNGRAQELGRRVQPLLAQRPEHNVITHKIRGGDTLGHIAMRYGSTIELIKRANGMRTSFLRAGRSLNVPLRGPCTHCPLPPEVVVPPRRLPPQNTVAVAPETPAPGTAAVQEGSN